MTVILKHNLIIRILFSGYILYTYEYWYFFH